ncbi:MAG: adenylate/guanylate cyclase domain-containing protein [Spirochaetes bacterium]|nr:adenylate/guanylate cyclase domain-containing protein [Spirochaetota bacterium]
MVFLYSAVSTGSNLLGTVFTLFLAPVMLLPFDRGLYLGMSRAAGVWEPWVGFVAFPFLIAALLPLTFRATRVFDRARRHEPARPEEEARFLDFPLVLSLLGLGGWLLTWLAHVAAVYAAGYGSDTIYFVRTLPLYLTTGGIVFVSAYYALDALNRHRYIPVLFPAGRLAEIRALRLSVRSRFLILFIAVGLNPLLIIGTSLVVAQLRLETAGLGGPWAASLAVVLALLAAGLALTAALASAFSGPLQSMARAARRIGDGDFSARVPVNTVDELGLLGERMNGMAEGLAERERMRETFGQVVDPRVRDLLLSDKIEGELLTATVLFLDVRGFTTLSEGRDPRQVVSLLNRLFSRVTARVEANGGLVNKFIGDAVLAVFGAPLPLPGHASHAVACAGELLAEVRDLGRELAAEGQPAVRVGIGIHTGEVMAGRIGGEGRLEYTVIGDAVNVASRLESATKELGTPVAISADCRAALGAGERESLRALRAIAVKGRREPVTVYGLSAIEPDEEKGT